MASIALEKTSLSGISSAIGKMISETSNAKAVITSVAGNLDFEVASKRNIETRLLRIKNSLSTQESLSSQYQNAFRSVTDSIIGKDSKYGNGATSIVGKVRTNIVGDISSFKSWFLRNKIKKISAVSSLFLSSAGASTVTYLDRIKNKFKTTADKVKNTVKNAYGKVAKATKDCVSWVKESYDSKGIVYTVAQYGKVALRIAGGVAAVAAAIGTGGALAPVAGIYGVNSIASAINDAYKITDNLMNGKTAEFEETDYLKKGLTEAGKATGKALGNEEIGEKIGEGIYGVGKVVSTVYTMEVGWDKIQQANDFNFAKIGEESKSAISGLWDLAAKTDIRDLPMQFALYKYQIPNTVDAVKNISLIGEEFVKPMIGGVEKIAANIIDGEEYVLGGAAADLYETVKEIIE